MFYFYWFTSKKCALFFAFKKKCSYLCSRKAIAVALGTLDEWLSQRSAKPCTAVRIRQVPQMSRINRGIFFISFPK